MTPTVTLFQISLLVPLNRVATGYTWPRGTQHIRYRYRRVIRTPCWPFLKMRTTRSLLEDGFDSYQRHIASSSRVKRKRTTSKILTKLSELYSAEPHVRS